MGPIFEYFGQASVAIWAVPLSVFLVFVAASMVIDATIKRKGMVMPNGTEFFVCMGIFLLPLLIAAIIHGGMTFVPEMPMVVLDNHYRVVREYQSGTRIWYRQNGLLTSYDTRFQAGTKTVTALTKNPGMRKVEIRLELTFGGGLEDFLKFINSDWSTRAAPNPAQAPSWGIKDEKIRSLLNRFENVHHSWVAENCYDDTNMAQQVALRNMLERFVAEEIATAGLSFHNAKFTLPN